jgi:hypothetical protein
MLASSRQRPEDDARVLDHGSRFGYDRNARATNSIATVGQLGLLLLRDKGRLAPFWQRLRILLCLSRFDDHPLPECVSFPIGFCFRKVLPLASLSRRWGFPAKLAPLEENHKGPWP